MAVIKSHVTANYWFIFRSILSFAQVLSCVCEALRAWNEWQAYNLDCILMLLPYAAKSSGDSWGTVRGSGGKGDIGFYAPVCWELAASHANTRWRQLSEFKFEARRAGSEDFKQLTIFYKRLKEMQRGKLMSEQRCFPLCSIFSRIAFTAS